MKLCRLVFNIRDILLHCYNIERRVVINKQINVYVYMCTPHTDHYYLAMIAN